MFAKNINLHAVLMLSIFAFVIIETSGLYFLQHKDQYVDITFCGNANCSGGSKENMEEVFYEDFKCHEMNKVVRSVLTRIQIKSEPKFARCIMLYNTANCTGESYTINGTDTDINLKFNANTETMDFLGKNVSSYEFCSTHQFRAQQIVVLNNAPDILLKAVKPFIINSRWNLIHLERLLHADQIKI